MGRACGSRCPTGTCRRAGHVGGQVGSDLATSGRFSVRQRPQPGMSSRPVPISGDAARSALGRAVRARRADPIPHQGWPAVRLRPPCRGARYGSANSHLVVTTKRLPMGCAMRFFPTFCFSFRPLSINERQKIEKGRNPIGSRPLRTPCQWAGALATILA
jgi:hypothetical protein